MCFIPRHIELPPPPYNPGSKQHVLKSQTLVLDHRAPNEPLFYISCVTKLCVPQFPHL